MGEYEKQRATLEANHPDLVQRLNEKAREDKERERKKKEKEEKHAKMIEREENLFRKLREELNWEKDFTIKLTDEEELSLKKQEKKQYEEWAENRKIELREERKEKEKQRKEAMSIPLPPLPERDLCPYEKLREKNIKERHDAMLKSNFFDDLSQFKVNIGLTRAEEDDTISGKKPNDRIKNTRKSNIMVQEKESTTNVEITKIEMEYKMKAKDHLEPEKNSIYENFHIDEWDLHDCLE